MERSIILSLLQNAAILLAFSLIYDYLLSRYQNIKNIYLEVLTGILLGIFGIIIIMTPWKMVPGIVFDVRSVLLSISGLFFGPIPASIAMLITGVYRYALGGSGMWMGIGVIVTSGTIGILWRVFRPKWRINNTTIELLAMGFVVHIAMLACTMFLPSAYAYNTLKIIFIPALTLYPLSSWLFGILMIRTSINWYNKKALRESEEKYRILLDESTDPIFSFEPNGKCLYSNKAFADGFGKSVDEIVGKNIGEFFNTEEVKKRYAEIQQVFDKGEEKIVEVRIQNNEIDRYFITTVTPIKDISGKVLSAISSSKDITNRKLAEEKLKGSEARLAAFMKYFPALILIKDDEFRTIYANKKIHQLFTFGKLLGKKPHEVFPREIADQMVESDLEALHQGYIMYEEAWLDKNGQQSIFNTQKLKIEVSNRETLLGVIITDITDRKLADERISKLNEELERKVTERTRELAERTVELAQNEAALLNLVEDLNLKSEELKKITNDLHLVNKELESFAYTVSHDLRAPLRALDGFALILLEDHAASLDEEGNRLLRVITYNAKKMGDLIDDLLSFSRLNRQEVRFSRIDMHTLANSVYMELASNADKEKIKFHLHKIPHAYGDPSMVQQVWVNLISNAIKFSSRKHNQMIEIGFKTEGVENIYYVKDNGAGFDMEHSGKLFGVFQRLHSLKDFDGTGVGLAIVQRIVLRLNGRVWAEGEVNEGATFYFSLPKQSIKENENKLQ
jgi:PAS domain S-box-containing protein